MYAIISELNKNASGKVNRIWQRLSNECELDAIFQLPTPHITWMISQDLNSEQAFQSLSIFVSQESPISTHTTGLGIFTGDAPVLYLPVVKNQKLLCVHQKLWHLLDPFVITREEVYSPEAWVPHVTLAINDLTEANLVCAINRLMQEQIRIEILIDSFSIVAFEDDIAGEIINRCSFQKPDLETGSVQ